VQDHLGEDIHIDASSIAYDHFLHQLYLGQLSEIGWDFYKLKLAIENHAYGVLLNMNELCSLHVS
jgi:hypothetical protein